MPKGNPGVPKKKKVVPELAKKFSKQIEEEYQSEQQEEDDPHAEKVDLFMKKFHKIYFKERKDASTKRE